MKSIRQIYLITLLIALIIFRSEATPEQKDFYFNHINTEQGLTNGIVNDMLRDREGFLWIATLNGLNCFDGSHFLTWKANPTDSNQLFNDGIYGLCEDEKGNIWCASNAGISRYNRSSNTFKNYELINAKTALRSVGSSNGIVCTRKGRIVTYSDQGIFVYDAAKDKFIHYPELQSKGTLDAGGIFNKSFLEDPFRNGIWMGTNNGLKYFDLDLLTYFSHKYNPKHWTIFNDHSSGPLALNNQLDLVFADNADHTIKTYSFSTQKITSFNPSKWLGEPADIGCLLVDYADNLWLSGSDGGVYFFEKATGNFFSIRHDNELNHSIAGDHFISTCQDKQGTIFLGTTNGISYFNPRQNFISVFRLPATASHNRRYYLHQLLNSDKQNNIWFAPSYSSLLKYDCGRQTFSWYDPLKTLKKKYGDDICISTMEADNEKVYFGTIDGIYIFDPAISSFNKLKSIPGLEGKYILTMLLSSKKELWFTSHKNGVYRYNIETGEWRHYQFDTADLQSFTSEYIYDMAEDSRGNIWFCAEHDGLLQYNPAQDNFNYVTRETSSKNPEIFFSLTADKQDNLWMIGFLGGLCKYNTLTGNLEKGVHVGGLSNFQYNHVLADDADRLWLSYYSHYSILDLKSGSARNFEVDHARPGDDYANYSCIMADGRIVTESRNSFFIFDPAGLTWTPLPEPITLSGFSAGPVSSNFISEGQRFELESNQNYFSINFSTLSLLNTDDVSFSYSLNGAQEGWIDCGKRQTAYFTNINGGNYVFKVRARIGNGEWKESNYPLQLKVKKVFFATVWFKALLFVLLLACVTWYIRFLKRRALKKESDKAIAYFANSMQGRNKVEELLWDITHNVITRTNLVDCVVYLLDEERGVLIQKAAYGDKNPDEQEILNPLEIPLGKGVVGNVALTGHAEIIADTSRDNRYIADDSFRYSEIAVPILNEGKVIGVIDSEHPQKNFFTKDHLELLQTIASISGTKIMNAKKEMELEENEKRLGDLRNQITQARQQALQAQMNPHFIFNCLNSINGFILKNDSATASTFLIKFSKLIRLILEHSHEKSITLQSELDALKLYIEMESLRFEKKFSYKIVVDPEVNAGMAMVPPLILQPFVENSIWHGLLHKEAGGELSIHVAGNAELLKCTIQDNGIGREMSASLKSKSSYQKKSLGLQLTRERLALLNEQEHSASSVTVIDLRDDTGKPAGTRVIINISLSNQFS